MNGEVIFIQKLSERRVPMAELGRSGFYMRAVLYINAACEYAVALGIKDLPCQKVSLPVDPSPSEQEEIQKQYFSLELFYDELRARNIFALEPRLEESTVALDADWKAKVSTWVKHIREIVNKAEIEEGLREGIFRALNTLQSEVDRNRTRMDATAEVWLKLTDAIGQGAKNLEPAVKLLEKLAGAFGKAKQLEPEAKRPSLPHPDEVLKDEDE